jgi:hypothetical protein
MKGLEDELFGYDSKSKINTFSAKGTSNQGKSADLFGDGAEEGDLFDFSNKPVEEVPKKKTADPFFQESPVVKPKAKSINHH